MSDKKHDLATPAQAAGLAGGHLLLGACVSMAAAAAFAGLWRSVKDKGRDTTAMDRAAAQWMHDHQRPGWTELAHGLAWSGSPPVMVSAAAAGACLGFLDRRLRGAAWTFPLAIVGAGAIIQGIKTIFKRPRPSFFTPLLKESGYSFPSGHSLIAVTVYGLLGYFAQGPVRGRAASDTIAVGTGTVIGAIGLSRVYVGVHYISDVLAGWTAGLPWLLTCIGLHEALTRHTSLPGQPLLPDSTPNPIEAAVMRPDS